MTTLLSLTRRLPRRVFYSPIDALGRCALTQSLSAGQVRVALAGLAAGSYTLQVQQGAARSFRHLVVAP